MKYLFLGYGALFGFILSRAGATTYDYYAGLFLFRDFQLLWVIAVAAALGAIGVAVLRSVRPRTLLGGRPLSFKGKPYRRGLVPGALLFGAGWGLAGACPGTALVMVGEGKLGALFTIAGIALGVLLHGLVNQRRQATATPATPQPQASA